MDNPPSYSNDAIKLMESMSQSVLITTPGLNYPGPFIIYVNKAFEEMTGWNRAEIIGKNPRILQGPKTNLNIFRNLREIIDQGGVWKGKTINYKKDGSEFYMEWSIAPVLDGNGEVEQLLAVQNDITQNVKTEEQLEKARKRELKRIREIELTNTKLHALTKKQKNTLELFVKYVPESVVKSTLDDTKKNIKKGVKAEAALLFCDIRDFTRITEKLSPSEVVRLLDTYYAMMADVIKEHNGVVNQFTGDEIFVTFGAPLPIKDPELSAALCAKDMIEKLEDINQELQDILPEIISVGIGLDYGPIIAGNLGSDEKLTFAITGNVVITAKRIESMTRGLTNTILISESIYKKTNSIIPTTPKGEVSVKGREEKIRVYQVL